MRASLAERVKAWPRLSSPAAARRRLEALRLPCAGAVERLLLGVADHSPYLWGLVEKDPAGLRRLLAAAPEDALAGIVGALRAFADPSDEAAMLALRRAKDACALLVALADLGGVWDLDEATGALSDFADAAIACALRHLLRQGAHDGRLALDARSGDLEAGCGLTVLALGKLGGRELNYSSDVDLMVLFNPAAAAIPDGAEPGQLFVRLAQGLVRLLQSRTADGYVLRVDLRLRPDPGSTPVALGIDAAFAYYESVGQNWERAALIKARPVAGDLALGRRFLADLAPFVWRKYFDYAAIADIHAMKRQIHAVRGHDEVAVAGHDVKLGRGGIREVELFVQTQQLIFGGRRPQLRGPRTLDMLRELRADDWVGAEAVEDLGGAYEFLRRVEHRLQMVDDRQTQRLPAEAGALARFAKFCGFADLAKFSLEATRRLRSVERHYARLFEAEPGLGAKAGNLVFTGSGDDPETLATLAKLGFREPAAAAETIRGWHFGRRAAVRTARAREALTELTPALLEAFGGSGDPDAALNAMDAALGRMNGAVELLSILRANAALRELFADILGSAPRLADAVAARPHLLDAAIDPGRAGAPLDAGGRSRLDADLGAALAPARNYEGGLDRARDFVAEAAFGVGVSLLSGVLDSDRAGAAYSALAEAATRAMLALAQAEFAREYGFAPGGRVAILALGKLGSREMTAASDLDLILCYDFDPSGGESSGPRALEPGHYYARLTQRFLAALTAPTKAGKLYEVDMRLRPSGRKGPLATHFEAFKAYQRGEAETWEHMALCRARVVAGDAGLGAQLSALVAATLGAERDRATLAEDVREMRQLIAAERAGEDPWDLKLAAGGLVDVEFAAQFLTLAHARRHPRLLDVSTRAVIAAAGEAGLLPAALADDLCDAHRLYVAATQVTRLAIDGKFDPANAASGAKRRIAAAAGLPDFAALEGALAQARQRVRAAFEAVVR